MACSLISMESVRRLIVALAMTQTCLSYADAPASESAQADYIAPFQQNWHTLEFNASGMTGSVTTRIGQRKLSATDVQAALLDAADLKYPHAASTWVAEMNVDSRIHMSVGPGFDTRERLWFNEDEGLPLQLKRIRSGSNPSSKLYRFGSDGVYRLRKKPDNETEAGQSPGHWSRSSESLYPLPKGECPSVLESLQLLYLLSSTQYGISEASQPLCVFNRKHVYQVKLRIAEAGPFDVDFLQVVGDEETEIRETLQPIHMILNSRPLGDEPAVKPFSFLGMQGEIHVLLSDPGRIPLRISGQVPGFGAIDLELKKLAGCAHQDCIGQSYAVDP